MTNKIVRDCISISSCGSCRQASVVPQALACLGGFFTLLNASWLCLTNLLAVVVTIPILVLVLLPSCIRVGKSVYVSVAALCVVNIILEIMSCLCDVSVRSVNTVEDLRPDLPLSNLAHPDFLAGVDLRRHFGDLLLSGRMHLPMHRPNAAEGVGAPRTHGAELGFDALDSPRA